MSYKTALLTECFITDHTGIWSLTTMCALMCYQTALLTECLITYFTRVWTLTPRYITGISAFSTVYMKLFIHSTLVKKQRVNIGINTDRAIIFMAMYTLNKNPFHLKNCVI